MQMLSLHRTTEPCYLKSTEFLLIEIRFRGRNASVILLSFYCISLVVIKSVLIKSFEMKQPFKVWIGFISICCSKVATEGSKSCPRLLVLQRVAQNAKSCSKVAEHNLFMPSMQNTKIFKTDVNDRQ